MLESNGAVNPSGGHEVIEIKVSDEHVPRLRFEQVVHVGGERGGTKLGDVDGVSIRAQFAVPQTPENTGA